MFGTIETVDNNFIYIVVVLAIIYYMYTSNVYTATTTATVSNVRCNLTGARCNYDYTYTVDGKNYQGKKYRGIKPASNITIKYNPTSPSESIV